MSFWNRRFVTIPAIALLLAASAALGGTYPGEVCGDYKDNDGDGQVDEGFDENGDGIPDCWDDDADGFTGYDGDCDDTDPAINPDAREKRGDGVDNNCNGSLRN